MHCSILFRHSSKHPKLIMACLLAGTMTSGTAFAQKAGDPSSAGQSANVVQEGEAAFTEDGYLYYFDQFGSATYSGTGSTQYTYNPSGNDVEVTRTGVGSYVVDFGTSGGGNYSPNVTAWATSNFCNISTFYAITPEINVECFDSAGNKADTRFSARWTVTYEDAFAWVDAVDASVPATFQNNPWGGAITAVKNGTGDFTVTVPGGPNFEGGHIQVTAYEFDEAGDQCKVGNWGSEAVRVYCHDINGDRADPRGFTFLRIGSEDDAYVWANDSTSTTAYTTSAFYSHNPQVTAPTSIKTAPGRYEITFPGLLATYGGNVQVTAYGSNDVRCAPVFWTAPTTRVSCVDSTGVGADTRFNVLFTRFQTCAGIPANVEIGNNVPTSGDDIIVGTAGNDTIFGVGGNDTICGMNGIDNLYGGPGTDTIYGGDGFVNDDTFNNLYGGTGDDFLYGGPYDDYLYGQGGFDYMETNNTLSGLGDIMVGGSGNDILWSFSTGGTDMRGNGNNDTLYGSTVADIMRGDPGLDTIYGGGGGDQINGGLGADTLYGGAGPDQITGADSRDDLFGGAGDDFLYGGLGNDDLDGGTGNDFCNGQGQTGGTGDTAVNCETTTGIPRVAPVVLNHRPGRPILTDAQVRQLDRCNNSIEKCLGL